MIYLQISLGNTLVRYGTNIAAINPPVNMEGKRIKSISTPIALINIKVRIPINETIDSARETIAIALFSYTPESN